MSLCVTFSRTDVGLYIYHLFVWSNLNFLHSSQWITLPTQLCLVLYSFWGNLRQSLIMCLMILSLSPHNRHLLFCCVLVILVSIWLVLMALFCGAIRRDSVSLLRFPFLSYVHVFSWEMLLINVHRIVFLIIVVLLVLVSSVLFFGGWNQSFPTLLYVVFKSLYWCVYTVFISGKSSSSFFSWHI